MAAPPEVTLKDLSGKFTMNKTLSQDPDAILALQGIGWMIRKAIGLATVTLYITQYADAERPAVAHIDIRPVLTGGIGASPEDRTLDWQVRPHRDAIFGDIEGKSRFVSLERLRAEGTWDEVEWLCEGWEAAEGEGYVQSWVENKGAGWTATQIWGFQMIEGKRYHCRKVVAKKEDKIERARLVYDYGGKG